MSKSIIRNTAQKRPTLRRMDIEDAKVGVIRNLFRPGDRGIVVYVEILPPTPGEATSVYATTSCGKYEYRRIPGASNSIVRELKRAHKRKLGHPAGYFFGKIDEHGILIVDFAMPATKTQEVRWREPMHFTYNAATGTLTFHLHGTDDRVVSTEPAKTIRQLFTTTLALFPLASCETAGKLLDPEAAADLLLDPNGPFDLEGLFELKHESGRDWKMNPGEVLESIYKYYGDWSRPIAKGEHDCPHGNTWGQCLAANCLPF